jgi:hypothetical protein
MRFDQVFGPGPLDEPEDEPHHDLRQPEWFGPPGGELGASVAVASVIGRSERGVVALSHAVAYSTGVVFEFLGQARGLTRKETHSLFHEQQMGAFGFTEDLPDGFLRIGLELPGGGRVSNLGRAPFARRSAAEAPISPVFVQCGGGGSQSSDDGVLLSVDYWLWPLPETGELSVSSEWPTVGIPLSTVVLDADRIRVASTKIIQLWPAG